VPTYSELRTRGDSIAPTYTRILRALAWTVGAPMFALLLYGTEALGLVYDDRWEGAYGAFRVLCLYGLVRSIGATSGAVFLAVGRPQLVRQIAQWQTLAMLALLVPFLHWWGITGVAWAVTVPLVVAAAYAVVRATELAGGHPLAACRSVAGIWAATLAATAAGLPALVLLDGWASLAVALAVAVAANLAFGRVALRSELTALWRHARSAEPDQESSATAAE
jgi:O-antigen/teichoic acid export membrane protein